MSAVKTKSKNSQSVEATEAVATVTPIVKERAPRSVKQEGWLTRNKIPADQWPATAYDCMKLMDTVIAAQKARRNEPPTELQLKKLESYGYNRELMKLRTIGFCSSLIAKCIKEEESAPGFVKKK